MEVLRLPGYTLSEKLAIAQRFLVPKQRKSHGLSEGNLSFTDDGLKAVIELYTREAGVRNLEREVASTCRKVARRVVKEGKGLALGIDAGDVAGYLGVPRFRRSRSAARSEVGVATGLAWTEVGGELLNIEISLLKGRGKLILTGKLGNVMQESAQAALSYARRKLAAYNVDKDFYRQYDIHVHIPEGAIPKDGPSAGITIGTALVSALLNRPVRRDIAMTGEITLLGRVLPVGGVKEKVLAAQRAGIAEVVVPAENEKDYVEEVPPEVRELLKVHYVDSMEEVLHLALEGEARVGEPVVSVPPDRLDGGALPANLEQ
jgi:ATP-dependent Lon protease